MDTTWMVAVVGGVVFAGLALIAITLYRLARRLLAPAAVVPPKQETPVDEDTELIQFLMRLDPTFKRQFPSLAAKVAGLAPARPSTEPAVDAATPNTPTVLRERTQPQLSHEGAMPELLSVRPDPPVIGGQPSQPLETPRAVPPIVTSSPPAVDPDLAAIVQIWTQLSPRDRRELRRLAEMKRDSAP